MADVIENEVSSMLREKYLIHNFSCTDEEQLLFAYMRMLMVLDVNYENSNGSSQMIKDQALQHISK